MTDIRIRRRPLGRLLGVGSHEAYHALMLEEALAPTLEAAKREGRPAGSVLVLGAHRLEADALAGLPFERVVLSGVREPDPDLEALCERHPHMTWELANAEALPYASASFDLVLAKEVLHHLARPALGLYEMLRVCRHRAVFVEPWDCALVAGLDRLGMTTRFERCQEGNLLARDNHVFRWNRRSLDALLASYYLESGSRCEASVGWLSTRVLMSRASGLRALLLAVGWAVSWLPGASGNLATVAIVPGDGLPPEPAPLAPCAGRDGTVGSVA